MWWRRTDRLTSVPSTPNARLQFRAWGGATARLGASDQEVNGGNPRSPIYRAPGGEPTADANCPSPRSSHALDDASLDELRCEWRRLYRSEPPRISRDLLIRGIGYRIQEIQHGGLGKSTRRKLKNSREDVPDRRPSRS